MMVLLVGHSLEVRRSEHKRGACGSSQAEQSIQHYRPVEGLDSRVDDGCPRDYSGNQRENFSQAH